MLLKLVRSRTRPTETIRALEELLREARAGNVTGIAFVAMDSKSDYFLDVLGQAKASPTFTLGAIEVLKQRIFTLACGKPW